MNGGDEIMAGRGWSWLVAAKLPLVMGGRGWSWLVIRFSDAQYEQHVSISLKKILETMKTFISYQLSRRAF